MGKHDVVRARQVRLGRRLQVSQVCFGTEHIIKYTPEEGGRILRDALRDHGVFFWDTAPIYGSHPQVRRGLALVRREEAVVCSKTFAESADEAREDVHAILAELGTEYIDLCLLHKVEQLDSRREALSVLLQAREQGRVRSVGLSTHSAAVVLEASRTEEIEVVCATLNRTGHSIDEGSPTQMAEALAVAHRAGKGTYVIKTLGQGTLASDVEGALGWVMQHHESIDAYNIGVASLEELRQDIRCVNSFYDKLKGRTSGS